MPTSHQKWTPSSDYKRLIEIVTCEGDPDTSVRGFAAKTLGALYEPILEHYFKQQRTAHKEYRTLRWAGGAWVADTPAGRKIRQDFLLRSPGRIGTGGRREPDRLICFEAKCWPCYQDFLSVNKTNAKSLAKNLPKFRRYVDKRSCWFIHEHETPDPRQARLQRPDAFGVLVFDYVEADREEVIDLLQREISPEVTELESISRMLATVKYNRSVQKNDELLEQMTSKYEAAERLFKYFGVP